MRSADSVASLSVALVGVLALGCGSEPTGACEPVFEPAQTMALEDLPEDTVVVAALVWHEEAPPPADSLTSRGIVVIHVFHYQPAMLVSASVGTLREYAADEGVEVSLGTAVFLNVCRDS